MIQRIQSLYWLGVIICLIFLSLGLDVFKFEAKGVIYEFDFFAVREIRNGIQVGVESNYYSISPILFLVVAFICLFSFKNLKRQLKLSKSLNYISILFFVVLAIDGFAGFIVDESTSITPLLGFYLTPIIVVLCFLATQGVKKDKKLLDSVDRIR